MSILFRESPSTTHMILSFVILFYPQPQTQSRAMETEKIIAVMAMLIVFFLVIYVRTIYIVSQASSFSCFSYTLHRCKDNSSRKNRIWWWQNHCRYGKQALLRTMISMVRVWMAQTRFIIVLRLLIISPFPYDSKSHMGKVRLLTVVNDSTSYICVDNGK